MTPKAPGSSLFLFTRCPQSVIAAAEVMLYLESGAPPRDSLSTAALHMALRELVRLDVSFQLIEDHRQ